jgi:hypothetical protein
LNIIVYFYCKQVFQYINIDCVRTHSLDAISICILGYINRKKKVSITGKKENFLLSLILFLHIYFISLIYILYVKSQTWVIVKRQLSHVYIMAWTSQWNDDEVRDNEIDICCLSAKHAALRRESKDWLAWNQDNVSELGDMSIRGLLFQWASTITNPNVLHWFLIK